jgi:hypothetical protein
VVLAFPPWEIPFPNHPIIPPHLPLKSTGGEAQSGLSFCAWIFTEVFALEVDLDVSCVETGEGVEPFGS